MTSSQPSRLNATIVDGKDVELLLHPGLHQHGTFNVTVTDGNGLQTIPPLMVIVQHVNHPPYLEHALPNVTMYEHVSKSDLILYQYFTDVDMLDQHDELAEVDRMNFSVRSLTPWLLHGQSITQNLSILPLANMHGLAALSLTATDSLGANVSAILSVTIIPVPDRPFVQRSLPELPNGTLRVPENSPDVRINVSFVFGDVDNCSLLIVQEACMFGPAGADSHVLSVNSSRPWKVNATFEGDDLVLHFAPFENSHSDDDIQINLTATDMFGLQQILPIAVIVEPIQSIPRAFLPDLHMIENQEPMLIHLTTAEELQGDYAFIDHDSYTNFYGDSVKFEVNTSEPDLLEVAMLTQARGAAVAIAQDCAFPFVFEGTSYANCTTAGTGLNGPRGYQARFSWCSLVYGLEITGDVREALDAGKIAKCKHSLKITVRPGHFGLAKVLLTAFDSFGGVGVGEFNVAVSMVNDPPLFTVPSVFEVNRASTLLSEQDTRVVKHFAIVHSLGFQESAPELPSAEDFCRVMPVRLKGDCHSLPPIVICNSSAEELANFVVATRLAVNMSMESFDEEKQYFLILSIARAAGVKRSLAMIRNITEEPMERRQVLFGLERRLTSTHLLVDIAILSGNAEEAVIIATKLTHHNVNSELQRVGMGTVKILMVSTECPANTYSLTAHECWPCPALTVSTRGSPSLDHCVADKGAYMDAYDRPVSTRLCPPGTYQDEFNQTTCKLCPSNSYQNATGASKCECISGWTGNDCSIPANANDTMYANDHTPFSARRRLMSDDSGCALRCPKMTARLGSLSFCPQNATEGQTVTFLVQHMEGDIGVFRLAPTINPEGTLIYELNQFRTGRIAFNVTLVDDGGTEYGGINQSSSAVVIDVLPLNIRP